MRQRFRNEMRYQVECYNRIISTGFVSCRLAKEYARDCGFKLFIVAEYSTNSNYYKKAYEGK